MRASALRVHAQPGDVALPGKVELAEISGSDTFVHVHTLVGELVAQLTGLPVNPHPMLTNVCMSFVDDTHVIHVASVHEYVPTQKTFRTIGGSGGVSDVRSDLEGRYANAWARNIWTDVLG